jgi:rifampin ADP-ribosylating transferase
MDVVELSTGVRTAYVDRPGEGPALLLIHGWAEAHGAFDRLIPLLPGRWRLIAPDLRGHGDSDKLATGYELSDYAADLAALLDETGVGRVVVVGSSSGGYVGQQLAVEHPDRLAGLVLVGSPIRLDSRPPFADAVDRLTDPVGADWVRAFNSDLGARGVGRSYLDDRVDEGLRLPADVWRATLAGLVASTPPTARGDVRCPTLVLVGGSDTLLGDEHITGFREAIPRARVIVYPETGHLVLWERPDLVARDVVEFVRGLG